MTDGFVNILKPSGFTSSDMVVTVRKILSDRLRQKIKVGHLGTLDPAGAGVLPIAAGSATKLFDYLVFKQKTYVAGLVLGAATDTLDSYGRITERKDKLFSINDIDRVLNRFIGEIEQIPPQYSALKIGGKKAYDLAREGINADLKARKITIYELSAAETDKPNHFDLTVTCSGGTYMRSLVRDIANALNTAGYMSYIVRTKALFDIKDSLTLDVFKANPVESIIPVKEVLMPLYPFFELPESYEKAALNGVKTTINGMPQGIFVLTLRDKIVGMAENIDGKLVIGNRL